jgi:hypothetical protein
MYTLFPEWVRIALWVLIVMMLTFLIYRVTIPAAEPKSKPVIYIISEIDFETLNGEASYVLTYSMDKVVQQQVLFSSKREREEFKGYLAEGADVVNDQ